jgi:hypothetical protein
MSRIMSVPAAVMGGAKVRSAEVSAPAPTMAAATPTAAAATTAPSSAATSTAAFTAATSTALRKRDICCAKRPGKCNPERAET